MQETRQKAVIPDETFRDSVDEMTAAVVEMGGEVMRLSIQGESVDLSLTEARRLRDHLNKWLWSRGVPKRGA